MSTRLPPIHLGFAAAPPLSAVSCDRDPSPRANGRTWRGSLQPRILRGTRRVLSLRRCLVPHSWLARPFRTAGRPRSFGSVFVLATRPLGHRLCRYRERPGLGRPLRRSRRCGCRSASFVDGHAGRGGCYVPQCCLTSFRVRFAVVGTRRPMRHGEVWMRRLPDGTGVVT